MLRTVIA